MVHAVQFKKNLKNFKQIQATFISEMTRNSLQAFNLLSFLDITHLTSSCPFISLFVVPGYAVADALDIEREKSLASMGWVSVNFDVPLRATFCGLFCAHCYSQ